MNGKKHDKPFMVKSKDDNMLFMMALFMSKAFDIVETVIGIAMESILMNEHNATQRNEIRGVNMLPVIDSWNRPDNRTNTYARMVTLVADSQHSGALCLPLKLVDDIMTKANVKHYQRCGDSVWTEEAIKVVFFKI